MPYANRLVEELATQLKAGLLRLRKGYVDAAESLFQILDPSRNYPYEFVAFRLTGFRPQGKASSGEMLSGASVRGDLLTLMLDLCDSFPLRPDDYSEPCYTRPALAGRFHVSDKTIHRWRRGGLPARRLMFQDGRRRVAFLESSVRWFIRNRRRQVLRSVHFSQMTDAQRDDIIRRARRMARFTECSLSDIARRLAARTGRAVETIRYTIRKHDREDPDQAVFPYLIAPLGETEKAVIYRSFLSGAPVPALARQYGRTRGSIYRVVNETRAATLLKRPIHYIYNPQFDLPTADAATLPADAAAPGLAQARKESAAHAPPDLPPYLKSLYEIPLLSASQERDLFRRYNFLKHKADRLRRQIDLKRVRCALIKDIESLLLQADAVKKQIIQANLRLVVSIARRHVSGPQTLFELISDGNVSLMHAVESFDYARGFRFSTYGSWAIIKNFARSVPKERCQLDRFSTGHEEALDVAASLQAYDPKELRLPELRDSVDSILARLSPRERTILVGHFGLDSQGQPQTLEQLSQTLGVSKERIRQIEAAALSKLRTILQPSRADLMA